MLRCEEDCKASGEFAYKKWTKSRSRSRSHNAHLVRSDWSLDVLEIDSHFEHRTEKRSRAVDL